MKKKYTLQEIKTKFPDYKEYIEILKKIKFQTGCAIEESILCVKHENRYINGDIEEILHSKFIDGYFKKHNTNCMSGSTFHELKEEMEEYLRKLPDFLNFLIKQL